MKFHQSEGFIINRLSLRDADRFLTIFTRDHGKISCYAKGIRKITSSRIAKLNLFSKIKFNYIEKSGRKTLTQVDLIDGYQSSKQDLPNISRLFQIGEIVDGLVPENQTNPKVYDLLNLAFSNLHKFDTPNYLIRFKQKLLKELGYGDHSKSDDELDRYIESILERPLKSKKIFQD